MFGAKKRRTIDLVYNTFYKAPRLCERDTSLDVYEDLFYCRAGKAILFVQLCNKLHVHGQRYNGMRGLTGSQCVRQLQCTWQNKTKITHKKNACV